MFVQGILPLGWTAWIAFGPPRARMNLLAQSVLGFLAVGVLMSTGLWLALPWYLPILDALILVVAIAHAIRRKKVRSVWPSAGHRRMSLLVEAAIVVLLAGVWVQILLTRRHFEGSVVDLVAPLGEGKFLVASGGHHRLVNAHLLTLTDPRLAISRAELRG